MRIYIKRYNDFLNQSSSDIESFILYHGSAYKFDSFDLEETCKYHKGQDESNYFFGLLIIKIQNLKIGLLIKIENVQEVFAKR